MYVELDVYSNYSFLQAASPPEDIINHAHALGYDAIALTDRDGLYGMVRAHAEAKKRCIRLIVGSELTLGDRPPYATMLVHVENHEGYTNLCRILTESHARHPKGKHRSPKDGIPRSCYAGIPIEWVAAHSNGLWATLAVEERAGNNDEGIACLHDAFGSRFSVRVRRHLDGEDVRRENAAVRAALRHAVPICATNAVRYATQTQKPTHDVLYCIREGITLEQAGRALPPNAEAYLKPAHAMADLFADHQDWIARSRVIADACVFGMDELQYKFPHGTEESPERCETPNDALRRLTYAGAISRYGASIPYSVKEQLEKELALIAQIDVASYFLSVLTIVNMARKRDILCQGRGSAANSAVCYCLGVTAVDPERSNLLFERFLSAERHEPPDIDIDFEHERREDVIQEIYNVYGRDRAAMVSEVIAYRGKSALRDVGKVFGLSLEEVNRLSSLITWWDSVDNDMHERFKSAGFDPNDDRLQQVLSLARSIQGFPRHLSIHVGGFVLSATPLVEVAPIEPATMPGRTVLPWDKDDLDVLGFYKVDVLSLGMLTAIRKALSFAQTDARIRATTAIEQLAKIPPEDPRVYEAFCRADTVGVFQVESRAQMSMLPRLRPEKFYDLVVEVAIVRPGPIQGGMIHPYLRRRRGEEEASPPHPILGPILERTMGVPLFQEQVMQMAIVGAGYSAGEADQLRRDMASWRKNGRLERHKAKLTQGFMTRGISLEFAERLYSQVEGFGEYGFPESHSASFALLVYASAWLKVHHPAAFAAALINSQPMGFYSPNTILQDASKHGVSIRPICIQNSNWDCTLEKGEADDKPVVRVGLRLVRGLGEARGLRIENARKAGPFLGTADLALRADLHTRELDSLAAAGAFSSWTSRRREALWKVRMPRGEGLFAGLEPSEASPILPSLTRGEQLFLDYEKTGISINDHPMKIARSELPKGVVASWDIANIAKGTWVETAGLVICRQRPETAKGVVFFTLEDEGGFVNILCHSSVFDRYRRVATQSSLLKVSGVIERDGEVVILIAKRFALLRVKALKTIGSMSRDFH